MRQGSRRESSVPFVALAEAWVLDGLRRAGVRPSKIRPGLDELKRQFGAEYVLMAPELATDGVDLLWDFSRTKAGGRPLWVPLPGEAKVAVLVELVSVNLARRRDDDAHFDAVHRGSRSKADLAARVQTGKAERIVGEAPVEATAAHLLDDAPHTLSPPVTLLEHQLHQVAGLDLVLDLCRAESRASFLCIPDIRSSEVSARGLPR